MHSLLGRKLAARCKAGTRLHAKLSTIQTTPTARDQQSGVTLRVIWAPNLPNIGSGSYRDSKVENKLLISKRKIQ